MNRSVFAVAALAAAFGVMKFQSATQATPPPASKQERVDGKKHDAATPLAQQMEKIDDAMTFLKRGLRDPAKRDECLAQVATAQTACVTAKVLVPKMAATTAEAGRPAFVAGYRKGMAALLIEFTNLEVTLLDGNQDASLASYKKLEKMKDDGHEAYTNE